MRRCVLLIMLVCCFSHASRLEERQKRQERTQSRAGAAKQQPIRLLFRGKQKFDLALDGITFWQHLIETAENAKAELKNDLWLRSTDQVRVDEEPNPDLWKHNPKDFEFLVTCDVNWEEQTKTSASAKLSIIVKESWKIERVAEPAASQTWTKSYVLTGEALGASKEMQARTAAVQSETVIAPARGPILKEIRAFIISHK